MSDFRPIDRAIPTSGHTSMYIMHKFFARKQEDVIREYIRRHSKKGDLVLDPFCGSGVMIGEALRLGRRTVGIDINPVSIFITKNTITTLNKDRIIKEFKRIEVSTKNDINKLYQTTCRKCNKKVFAICYTWKDKSIMDVRYECPQHGRIISPVNDKDLRLLKKIDKGEISNFFDENGTCLYWYPTDRLYYSDGTPFLKKERFNSVDEIFSRRNLIALAKLYARINEIEELDLKEAFKFSFTSMTHLASRMTPVRPSRPFSSAWVQQSYWYCNHNMESNVWNLFERAIKGRQGLVKAKSNLPENFMNIKEATSFNQLIEENNQMYLLLNISINDLKEIKEESIDYVITDPPYGHSIQYGELLYMWGSWLRLMENFEEVEKSEIINNPRQKKDNKKYEKMLREAFERIFQVLKPGRYCTVTFHNPSLKYRNILFRSVLLTGFEFEKIIYQPPPRASAKSLLQPFGSQKGDYFFRFKKPITKKKVLYKPIEPMKVEELIVKIIKRILVQRGTPTHYTEIQNSLDPLLYEELRKSGLLMDFEPEEVERILLKHLGKEFQLVDIVLEGIGNKQLKGKGWWVNSPLT